MLGRRFVTPRHKKSDMKQESGCSACSSRLQHDGVGDTDLAGDEGEGRKFPKWMKQLPGNRKGRKDVGLVQVQPDTDRWGEGKRALGDDEREREYGSGYESMRDRMTRGLEDAKGRLGDEHDGAISLNGDDESSNCSTGTTLRNRVGSERRVLGGKLGCG